MAAYAPVPHRSPERAGRAGADGSSARGYQAGGGERGTSVQHGTYDRVVDALDDLITQTVSHFAYEERDVVPLANETLRPAQLKAFSREQARQVGFRGAGQFFPWLLEDANTGAHEVGVGFAPATAQAGVSESVEPTLGEDSPVGLRRCTGRLSRLEAAPLAQLAEQLTLNQRVRGSSP